MNLHWLQEFSLEINFRVGNFKLSRAKLVEYWWSYWVSAGNSMSFLMSEIENWKNWKIWKIWEMVICCFSPNFLAFFAIPFFWSPEKSQIQISNSIQTSTDNFLDFFFYFPMKIFPLFDLSSPEKKSFTNKSNCFFCRLVRKQYLIVFPRSSRS